MHGITRKNQVNRFKDKLSEALGDVISPKKNGELISMNMIFIDEKGNLMHGIIRKNKVNRFKDELS
ncbi:hypothetical protein H5410_037356 [Solanum commersonii]|uniref:Uncharacterized protein n=1 Tax=Solanum commersonii TaxID=4109 RepID=A0A9J5Y9Z2_SOLCO|nr:hypothetical protein H5410_037356 [Solanum commersonii]